MAMQELVAQMLLWMTVNTPYTMPSATPEVTILPQEHIQEIICQGPCPALAAYTPDRGVLLSDQLDLRNNICDRSILLHELVHFFQYDAQGTMPSNRRSWSLREYEAYQYQNRFLEQNAAIAPEPAPRDVRQCRYERRQKMRQDFLNKHRLNKTHLNKTHQHSITHPGQKQPPDIPPQSP